MRFCIYCGYKLHDDDRFCPECGKEVVDYDNFVNENTTEKEVNKVEEEIVPVIVEEEVNSPKEEVNENDKEIEETNNSQIEEETNDSSIEEKGDNPSLTNNKKRLKFPVIILNSLSILLLFFYYGFLYITKAAYIFVGASLLLNVANMIYCSINKEKSTSKADKSFFKTFIVISGFILASIALIVAMAFFRR